MSNSMGEGVGLTHFKLLLWGMHGITSLKVLCGAFGTVVTLSSCS